MIDDIIELFIDILIEGSLEILPNKKIPKWLRFLAWSILVLIILIVISVGLLLLKTVIWLGVILIIGALIFIFYISYKIKYHDESAKKDLDE